MKWKILFLSFGITLLCVLIFTFASALVYYRSSIDDSKQYLKVYMNAFDGEYSLDNAGALAFSEKLNGARITFMDGSGNVLADSNAEDIKESHADREEVKNAILNGEGFAVRGSSTLGKNMVYYCKSFPEADCLVRIAVFTDSDWKIFVSTLPALAQYTLIMIALCIVLSVTAAHFVKKEKAQTEKARASKDEFISNVTHEMNTPLTSIHGYAELLNAGGMNEAQQALAYKTILTQSERLSNLIACIINYSELDNDELPSYRVDFSAVAKEMLFALKPEADKKNVTIYEKIEDNVTVYSRRERVIEIFGNLVRNAIKYNKDGGSVTVTLTGKELIVEDSGIGIAEENLDKVFSRFFTVDKSHSGKNGGFGLGLAVVKKICRNAGWQISVESKLGEGSKFTVKF